MASTPDLSAAYSFSPADVQTLASSPLFRADWYLAQYPDVAESGMDPAEHYLRFGSNEGRDPGPKFSSSNYLRGNPDISEAGMNPLLHYIQYGQGEGRLISSLHEQWIDQNDTLDAADRKAIQQHISTIKSRPLISIIVPVYRTDPAHLRQMINSVKTQSYPNWECCVADDDSQDPGLAELLRDAAAGDSRFRLAFRTENGNICAATNTALALAKGEFVCFLDHDDLLHENALYEVAVELDAYPATDLVFSDFDCVNQEGHRYNPYFKTEWNYDLMLGHNMVSHLGVYRRSLVEAVGGLRIGFEGSQDYDLALRIADVTKPDRIRHIPAILYHWRRSPLHRSFSSRSLERCFEAARAAIADHLRRGGIQASVEPCPTIPAFNRVIYPLPDPRPLVTVGVMATGDPEDLRRCLSDLLFLTEYEPLEVLVQTAHSAEKSYTAFPHLESSGCMRILQTATAHTPTEAKNLMVREARGEVVIFLDADLRIGDPAWMTELVSQALRPDAGFVAPLIEDLSGNLASIGIVRGSTPSGPIARSGDQGYYGVFALTREVSAVRSACVAFRRSVYLDHLGFAERRTMLESEIEFCTRMRQAGLRNIVTPYCTVSGPNAAVASATFERSAPEDDFYNPNLSLEQLFTATSSPSRRVKPWSGIKKQITAEKHRAQRIADPVIRRETPRELIAGIAGTFDIENYGDLLFPMIASAALGKRNPGIRVVPYSVNAKSEKEWPFAVESLEDLPAQVSDLSAMLIGGGQIIRFDKYYPVPVPASADLPLEYWLSPAVLAALTGKPVIWNAVGAWTGSPPAARHSELVRQVFEGSYFIGVRDAASKKYLGEIAPDAAIDVLPDTAFALSRLWPLQDESAEFTNWRERLGLPGRYVILQGSVAVARNQESIQALRGCMGALPAVVLPICWCHGDRAEHLEQWRGDLTLNSNWLAPSLISEILGRAEFVFASSMHACITALSYGVPVARVSISNDRKYEALGEFEGIADLNHKEAICRLFRRGRYVENRVREYSDRLERYWDDVAQVMQNPPAEHLNASKSALLRWAAQSCGDRGRE